MPLYTQAHRPLKIFTPLGPDVLLLAGFSGREAISELYRFRLQLVTALGIPIPFEKLLGQPVAVELDLPGGITRYVHGLVASFAQGQRDEFFTHFEAEIVPQFWLLTQKVQSRIFQQQSVPDILQQVLSDLRPNVRFQLTGNYYPRDYCVQYRESDFAFASRLMEEEGIYYFFQHSVDNHVLIVTDSPTGCPELPAASRVPFEDVRGGFHENVRVVSWKKKQEIRTGRHTLRDYCFELPDQNLQAAEAITDEVQVGTVKHTLKCKTADLEHYDYPGGYAKRFDGVDPGGGNRSADVQHVFEDNQRVARLRAQEGSVSCLRIEGTSTCAHFLPGHTFTLQRHFDGDGDYLLTRVEHEIEASFGFRSGEKTSLQYRNRFECLPRALTYRPPCVTPRPIIAGPQTAVVVGVAGSQIYVDKYGRVKVQFHWDRQGKNDANSSCWVRVAQIWAGNTWGAFFWPRVGHEVVVAFEDGDPDQPIIVGSVYNAKNMPPINLPAENTVAGIKSCIFNGNPTFNFNALVFHDTPGVEYVQIHSERNEMRNSESNNFEYVPQGQFTFHGSL